MVMIRLVSLSASFDYDTFSNNLRSSMSWGDKSEGAFGDMIRGLYLFVEKSCFDFEIVDKTLQY